MPTTSVRRRISRLSRSEGLFEPPRAVHPTVENQAANAAAAASASAGSAAQLAKDEDSATQLIAGLREVPGKLSGYLSTMDGHLQQALADLAKTRADATKGQGDGCYNVGTVAYDASSDVGYDATDDVGYEPPTTSGDQSGPPRLDVTADVAAEHHRRRRRGTHRLARH